MRHVALLALSLPFDLCAQVTASEQVGVEPFSTGYLLQLTGGLLLVVCAIFIFAWLLKRLKLTQASQTGLLRIVAGLSVGNRERIVILQVGEQQLLLGISPGRIEKLHTLSEAIELDQQSASNSSFAQKLNQLMQVHKQQ